MGLYRIILHIAIVVSGAISFMSWKRRSHKAAKSLSLLMIAITEWVYCQLMTFCCTSNSKIFFWHELKYIGIVIVPIAFVLFVAEYTDRKVVLKKNVIILLSILPLLTLLIILTNNYHGLFRTSVEFVRIGEVKIVEVEYGIWFWVHTFYSYMLIFKGLLFLLIELIHFPKLYRKQISIIIAGALIPWIWNVLYILYFKEKIHFDITPLAFSLTGIIFFWGVIRYRLLDLTPIAKELVFESIEDIVIVLDNNKRIVDINSSAKRILGNYEFEVVGEPINEVLPELYKLSSKEINEGEKKIILTGKEEKRYFGVKEAQICDEENKAIGNLVILHDITEHENIMTELRVSREKAETANRAKSIFLANMSHEIRTPMNGVLGMIDLMKATKLDEDQKDNLKIMKDSAEALLTILNDILDYSKIEAEKMELENTNFNVKQMVQDIIKIFSFQAIEKKINLLWDIDEEIPDLVVGDPLRIRQIINNLISNSVKFTSEGFIKVSIRVTKNNSKEVALRFIIEDTGIGIPKEKIKNLFNSFEQIDSSRTRKYGGTGLGLAIVKNLVELMKGSISVESEIDKGSRFTIDIPFKIAASSKSTHEMVEGIITKKLNDKELNILLAEDNKVNQLIMEKMFRKNGWNIKIAKNGQQVLEEIDNDNFDIIFMDIQMPILDGYETTMEIRKKQINIPIIALTANAMEGDRQKCLACGMDDFIPKPVIYTKVIEIINEYT